MTLTEQQIKDLNDFIAELPVKYGLPLIQIFNKIQEEQKEVTEDAKLEEIKDYLSTRQ